MTMQTLNGNRQPPKIPVGAVASRLLATVGIISADIDDLSSTSYDVALEQEFELRRGRVIASGRQTPLVRVAAFLVSLSRINANEGRDPLVVTETCTCGFVADYLGLSVDSLAAVLVELERRGLIEPCLPGGLRLKDICALDAVAAQPAVPLCPGRREGPAFKRERGAGPRSTAQSWMLLPALGRPYTEVKAAGLQI
jgi:Crp-like helix-turn-helix domain